jgi:GDP-4-dehydro-6-deoxy-D-mannose reductase
VTRVLVTGANGFIGRRLVKALLASGVNVVPVGREHGDLAGEQAWENLPGSEVVVHLAGRSYVPDSWHDGSGFLQANVMSTGHALEYCRRQSARLIFVSAYVYGVPKHLPIREDDPASPNNPYALSKRMAEEVCEFYSAYFGVHVTVLRLFNKDLKPRRDYVYLDDVVDAVTRVLDMSEGQFGVFNIGSGESLSVGEIINSIQLAAGTSLPVLSDSIERPQEIPDVRADITRAMSILGWKPRYSFSSGIQSILNVG